MDIYIIYFAERNTTDINLFYMVLRFKIYYSCIYKQSITLHVMIAQKEQKLKQYSLFI